MAKIFNAAERKKRLKYVNEFSGCHTISMLRIELDDSRKPVALKGQYRKADVLFKVQTSEVFNDRRFSAYIILCRPFRAHFPSIILRTQAGGMG
jgi:hypothetical protein